MPYNGLERSEQFHSLQEVQDDNFTIHPLPMQKDTWMATFNLQDAYFHLTIHLDCRQYPWF